MWYFFQPELVAKVVPTRIFSLDIHPTESKVLGKYYIDITLVKKLRSLKTTSVSEPRLVSNFKILRENVKKHYFFLLFSCRWREMGIDWILGCL